MFAHPGYTVHVCTITVSEQPNAQRPAPCVLVLQALSSPKSQTYVRMYGKTHVRTTNVCFIEDKPHKITCILHREYLRLVAIRPKMLRRPVLCAQ